MSFISSAVQADLGDGYIVPGPGVWYILGDAAWVLIVPMPEAIFPPDVVDAVAALDPNKKHIQYRFADWRILTAKDIDLERGLFLPDRGRTYKQIGSRYSTSPTEVQESVDRMLYAITDEGLDLTAMFRDGELTPVYPNRNPDRLAGGISTTAQATRYVMHEDGKVLVLHGPVLRALDDMGFQLVVPTDFEPLDTERGFAPSVGGRLEVNNIEIYALTTTFTAGSGILTAPDGRELFVDAVRVSWFSVDQALQLLEDEVGFFSPSRFSRYPTWGEYIAQDTIHTRPVRYAISILRWHGIEEEQIEQLLNERLPDALETLYNNTIQRLHELREVALARETWRKWDVRQLTDDVRTLSDMLDTLEPYFEGDLPRGPLAELVDIVVQLEALQTQQGA